MTAVETSNGWPMTWGSGHPIADTGTRMKQVPPGLRKETDLEGPNTHPCHRNRDARLAAEALFALRTGGRSVSRRRTRRAGLRIEFVIRL